MQEFLVGTTWDRSSVCAHIRGRITSEYEGFKLKGYASLCVTLCVKTALFLALCVVTCLKMQTSCLLEQVVIDQHQDWGTLGSLRKVQPGQGDMGDTSTWCLASERQLLQREPKDFGAQKEA